MWARWFEKVTLYIPNHGLVCIYDNIMTSDNSTTMLIVGCGLNPIIFINIKKIICQFAIP